MIRLEKDSVVVFAGDSITHGNRGPSMDCNHIFGHGYQTVVAGYLGADNIDTLPRFVNTAHAGWTLPQIEAQWEAEVLAFRPSMLSILIGFNDAQTGFEKGLSPLQVEERYTILYDDLLIRTREALPECRFVLLETFFLPSRIADPYEQVPHPKYNEPYIMYRRTPEHDAYLTETVHRLSIAIRRLAERHNCTFVPLSDMLREAADRSAEPYLVWDGIHPTIVGHELIARQWIKAVDKSNV